MAFQTIMSVAFDPYVFKELRAVANRKVWNAWHTQFGGTQKLSEVPCIKNLVQKALPDVDRAWRALFPRDVSVNVRAVLCHGKPWVTYAGAGGSCELGDFLLVHDHQVNGQLHTRRAALVQAKLFDASGVPRHSRNSTQLALYQAWPSFTYTAWPGGTSQLHSIRDRFAAISPTPLTRNFAQGHLASKVDKTAIDDGARYGMIDLGKAPWRSYKCPNPWRLCGANVRDLYNYTRGHSLAGYLLRLIIGRVGRDVPSLDWPSDLHSSCHWSLVVKELLQLLPSAVPSGVAHSGSHVNFLTQPPNSLVGIGGGSEDASFAVVLATTNAQPDERRD